MAIWGHDYVRVEKDVVKKEWRVYVATANADGTHTHLTTVPWADSLKVWTHVQQQTYKDYIEAIHTCMSGEETRLTHAERHTLMLPTVLDQQIEIARQEQELRPNTVKIEEPKRDLPRNVLSMDAFRKKRAGDLNE